MGNASYIQSSFLGGEWAPEVQGRSDSNVYKTAMNTCSNYYPIEQGSLLRRQGFMFVGHTKNGNPGKLFDFDLAGNPLQLELTDGWIRFISGSSFVSNGTNSISSISTATPAVVETMTPHGWATGNTVFFTLASQRVLPSTLFNRQFVITVVDATHFSLVDALTGEEVDGSAIGWNGPVALLTGDTYQVSRIAELASPYVDGEWADVTTLQDDEKILFFHLHHPPRQITQTANTCFGFAISTYVFKDGPYLEINKTTTTMTPSATTGTITVTASSIVGINDGTGFQPTDVGRQIRLYLVPPDWDATSNDYRVGDMVTYVDGNVYVAIKNDNGPADNDGVAAVPTNIDHWSLIGYVPAWGWLIITVVDSTTVVHATIQKSTQTTNDELFNILPTLIWRLGAYSDTTTYPTLAEWHEGRMWLAGAILNRFDATMADDSYVNCSPTSDDGAVSDANGITFTTKANEKNATVWMQTDDNGLLYGTKSSEWRLRASTLDDPISPSSIQARRQSKYGSSTRAIRAGKFNLFVQFAKRKIMEVIFGNSSKDIQVTNLSLTASHLSVTGLRDIAYAKEQKPTVWAFRTDGTLVGMTYIRDEEKLIAGWHQHPLGHGRPVTAISTGPSLDEFSDRLYIINQRADGTHWVEMMTDVFDDNKGDQEGFFADSGASPGSAKIATVADDGFDGVKMYGFFPFVGESLAVTLGGMDLGDFVVAADGSISLPYQVAIGFTLAYIQTLGDIAGNSVNIVTTDNVIAPTTRPDDTGKGYAYVGPDNAVHGVSDDVALVDPERNRVIMLKQGNTNTDGVRVFSDDENADEEAEYNRPHLYPGSLTGSDFIFSSSQGGAGMKDFAGNIYFARNAANIFTWEKIDKDTFIEVASCLVDLDFNGAGSTTPIRSLGHDGTITNYALMWGGDNMAIINTETDAFGVITAGKPAAFLEDFAGVCSGPMLLGSAVGYAIGFVDFDGGPTTDPISLYRVMVADNCDGHAVDVERIISHAPSVIDATWTNFNDAQGLMYDQLDGNIIGMVSTTDVVTNQQYIVKFNARTGAVMWKVATNSLSILGCGEMNRNWLTRGTLCWLSPSTGGFSAYPVYKINTLTGSFTVDTYTGTQTTGSATFDDRTGCITWFGNFTTAGVNPTGTGTYLLAHPAGYTGQWGRLGVILPAGTVTPLVYPAPAVVGYTYTSRGQLLRPDHGNDAGARNGPAFGKIRRNHWFAALLNRTQNIKFGIDFGTTLKPVKLQTKGGTTIAQPTLFSGIVTDTVSDDYGFDGMLAFQQTRPTPGQILSVAGYIASADK